MEPLIAATTRRLGATTFLRGPAPGLSVTAGSVRCMAAAATAATSTATTLRRTAYVRAKPATGTTTYRRTIKPAAAAGSTAATASPDPPAPELEPEMDPTPPESSIDDFPMPPPVAALPDYAALAPPPEASDLPPPPPSGKPSSATTGAGGGLAGRAFPGEEPVRTDEASDWGSSFHGLSAKPFDKEVAARLMRPLTVLDVEVKPDGLLYLPEIKYRRTLNEAFGPGGWGLAPRGETNVGPRIVSREWGLVCLGRLVSVARGEQEYFDPSGIPTATEACKSNALMRCCKDLGIASELWDPTFIKKFKKEHCVEAYVEHAVNKRKRKLWRKKNEKFDYPYKEV